MCTCTVLCNLPKVVLKLVDFSGEMAVVTCLSKLLYWLQFSGDFLIYAASNKQYREAYLLLLTDICCACKKTSAEGQNQMQLAQVAN